jgi:sialidase-1
MKKLLGTFIVLTIGFMVIGSGFSNDYLSANHVRSDCFISPEPMKKSHTAFEKCIILAKDSYEPGAYAIPKMVVTKSGVVIIVFQDREGGDWGKPIHPMMMRSTDHGKTWSEPYRVGPALNEDGRFFSKPTGIICDQQTGRVFVFLQRNPVKNNDGKVVLETWFYTHIKETWDLGRTWYLVYSDDDGVTWSKPVEIIDQLRQKSYWQEWSPVHSGFQISVGSHKGRLVVPVRCYCPEKDFHVLDWRNQTNSLIYSDDGGITWNRSPRTGPQVGECSIAELSDGSIYVNQRIAPQGAKTWRTFVISRDGGLSFAESGDHLDLPDVKCHAGLISAHDPEGRHTLIFSNVPGPGSRKGLTIQVSHDDGRSWYCKKVIESGPAAYSDLAITKNGIILCVFETNRSSRRDLGLARMRWDWIYDD